MLNPVLLNLSFLFAKPTGITTYAFNLFPHLQPLNPTLLIAPEVAQLSPTASAFNCYPVPANLTPAQGSKGHLRRLLWTQLQVPRIYRQLHSPLLFSPLPEAPLFTNCRYVVTVHDLIPLRFPQRHSPLTIYFRYYIPQVLAQAQHIICDSTATAQDITHFFDIPASKITPVLLAYNAEHFRVLDLSHGERQTRRRETQQTRRMEMPPENSLTQEREKNCSYFLYIGRHDPYKNLHRLIEAFAGLPNHRDYELWITGPTDERYTPLLIAQAAQLGIATQVKFLNYVPYEKLPIIINQAIALVFPSLWEGFGLPVLEAMACGTPVITSNLSSLPEAAGNAALLIDPYKTGEITEAMQAIATDSQLRSHLSTLGLARVSQLSWAKTGQATVEVLKRYL
ncbi:MAG: glycosyltransferase family 4 protein [Symploca sp. SIO2E6]|nr:glycosyltransferase family 4 protein [Symploca sp. SIO2E6]